jgi:outer membrane lipoprotein-sorting protein
MLLPRQIVSQFIAVFVFSLVFQTVPATAQGSLSKGASKSDSDGSAAAYRLMQALGGAAKVNGVRTLRQTFKMEQQGQPVMVDQSIVYPDKQVQRITTPQGETVRIVVTPTTAFMAKGRLVRALPPTQSASSNAALKHDFLNVLQHINNPKYKFSARAKEKLGTVEATVVDVHVDGTQTRWWISEDGKLLQEQYSETAEMKTTTQLMKYSDWRSFDGLEYPAMYEMYDETGQLRMRMRLVKMEVNAAVDPELFEKPHN